MYKLVFFDLDGTLLNDKKEILLENISEIKRIEQLGVKTVLCSGRQINAIKKYKIAQTSPYIICANGAEIFDYTTNTAKYLNELTKNDIYYMHKMTQQLNLLMKIDTPKFRYINNIDYASFEELQLGNNFENLVQNDKIIQISLGHEDERIINDIITEINSTNSIKVVNKFLFKEISKKNLWIINIVNSDVSKGNAIKKLCNILNININDTIAFGDDSNDLSMIESVGYGVAMGNANNDIKQIAKTITTNNNTSGIASILKKLI